MLAAVFSAGVLGVTAQPVRVEVDLANGFPGWQIVGLPETAVKESKERVTAAIRNSGIQLLARKITVNLSPAQWKKTGAFFDLPIALGLLAASELVPLACLQGFCCVGELALNGDVLPLPGILPIALATRRQGLSCMIVPVANVTEAQLVPGLTVIGVRHLNEVLSYLENGTVPQLPLPIVTAVTRVQPDFSEVKGQGVAKRALCLAAAGGHNMLMISPPGSGKTMLAERLPSILPPLADEQILETSCVYSAAGLLSATRPVITHPPFRAPYHSASLAGLCGSVRAQTTPGELSLAHHGVLFLDEFPEFRRDVLEALREPMESGVIRLTRAGQRVEFPARFQLLAAMNPCPCGYYGHPQMACQCDLNRLLKYRQKVSGPLLDRIDLQVNLQPLSADELLATPAEISSQVLAAQVSACRQRQQSRFGGGRLNAHMGPADLRQHCVLDRDSQMLLQQITRKGKLSGRGFDRVLRVARTIADWDASDPIQVSHIAEALQYRQLERPL